MRVGQIRAVATKLFEELNDICKEERKQFEDSLIYMDEVSRFAEQSEVCRRLTEAYELLQTLPEYVSSIKIRRNRNDSLYYNYYRTYDMERDTNLSDEIKKEFNKCVTFNYSYNVPSTVEGIYNLLEYKTITSSNLLEVESAVKESLRNPSGFSVTY